MWYKPALALGESEGVIQCTYAIIYDKDGNRVFALQRKHWEERYEVAQAAAVWQRDEFGNGAFLHGTDVVYTGSGQEGIFYWDDGSRMDEYTENTGYMTIDFPLVRATEYSADRLVPVKLLPEAVGFIRRSLSSTQKEYYTYVLYEREEGQKGKVLGYYPSFQAVLASTKTKKDGWDKTGERQWTTGRYICEAGFMKNPKLQALKERISEHETYYVKPAAFNWHPNSVRVDTDALKKAKADLDRAKAILIAAGFGALI